MRDSLLIAITVGSCGAMGALVRYGVSSLWNPSDHSFPWGTFAVNIFGCFLLGALYYLPDDIGISPALRTGIGAGFVGSLTTFSTLSLESLVRSSHGLWSIAVANLAASVVLGLLAVWLGKWTALWIFATPPAG